MNSSGFGHLVVALPLAHQQQRTLFLCGLSAPLLMLLQLTGTAKMFQIFESRQDREDSLAATRSQSQAKATCTIEQSSLN